MIQTLAIPFLDQLFSQQDTDQTDPILHLGGLTCPTNGQPPMWSDDVGQKQVKHCLLYDCSGTNTNCHGVNVLHYIVSNRGILRLLFSIFNCITFL